MFRIIPVKIRTISHLKHVKEFFGRIKTTPTDSLIQRSQIICRIETATGRN